VFRAAYLELATKGELKERITAAYKLMENCCLCPRQCGINRLANEKGFCRSGKEIVVSSYGPHYGEERPLVGHGGSGTIFFTNCNLGCIFCQNYDISHLAQGREVAAGHLAQFMLELQRRGCHNINFVTPTHFVPQILEALDLAIEKGLHVPLVYNCGGYEALDTLKLLEGIFDIYMPDIKYADPQVAEKYSLARDYPEVAQVALKEMYHQVGDLIINDQGIAQRGLLVRHLVLPQDLAGTARVMAFIAQEISLNTYVNIMNQYRPCYKAISEPELNRRITADEYEAAIRTALNLGLHRLDRYA
jgi:putative pyruvate formate lyase activating enzyme